MVNSVDNLDALDHGRPLPHTVLTVEHLTVYRHTHAAVQDVSFAIAAGTDTAIVGPNGAGKSTLVQAILGILPRQSGAVSVLGHRLSRTGKLPNSVRQQIAYLPQTCLFDRRIPITVAELVGLGWDRLGLQWPWQGGQRRRAAIHYALNYVDAWHLRDHLLSGLSGGETKRVLLAYCLVRPRRLLILDEAPAGLDLPSEREFYQLLAQLKQAQGWAILQICHNLEMVRQHCDRVICLNQSIQAQGLPTTTLSEDNLTTLYSAPNRSLIVSRHFL